MSCSSIDELSGNLGGAGRFSFSETIKRINSHSVKTKLKIHQAPNKY